MVLVRNYIYLLKMSTLLKSLSFVNFYCFVCFFFLKKRCGSVQLAYPCATVPDSIDNPAYGSSYHRSIARENVYYSQLALSHKVHASKKFFSRIYKSNHRQQHTDKRGKKILQNLVHNSIDVDQLLHVTCVFFTNLKAYSPINH